MTDLLTTAKLVETILEQDTRARNSDSFLFFRVIGVISLDKGIDLNKVPITVFLLKHSEWGFPGFETVRRTRQKVQAKRPELAASERVQGFRAVNEIVFHDYAKE